MFDETAIFTLLCGPSFVFVAAAIITTLAAVYCALALRIIMRRSHYAWGETNGRVTQLERALEAERERLQALRRIIMRGERAHRLRDNTNPQGNVNARQGFVPAYLP